LHLRCDGSAKYHDARVLEGADRYYVMDEDWCGDQDGVSDEVARREEAGLAGRRHERGSIAAGESLSIECVDIYHQQARLVRVQKADL
jgi:hypothetical protein